MKKLLLTLLCVGGIVGLPGCGGSCRQACEAPCDRMANENSCYEEVMEDGSVRKVCSNGQEVTVYENLRADGMQQKGKKKVKYQTKSRPINPTAVDGRPMKYLDPNIEEQITYEAPMQKSSRAKPMRKEIIEDDMMMMEEMP